MNAYVNNYSIDMHEAMVFKHISFQLYPPWYTGVYIYVIKNYADKQWLINTWKKCVFVVDTADVDDRVSKPPAWISNYMPGKVWGEITYPFLNFNGATVEV